MVYAQYCTLFDLTNKKFTSIIFINVIWFLFSLVHKMFLGFYLQDMLGASMDTSPSTLEWALYELWFMSLFFIVDCFNRIEIVSSPSIHCILSNLNQPPSNVKEKDF